MSVPLLASCPARSPASHDTLHTISRRVASLVAAGSTTSAGADCVGRPRSPSSSPLRCQPWTACPRLLRLPQRQPDALCRKEQCHEPRPGLAPQTVTSKDPKAAAAAASDMRNIVRRKLTGYVGFANLPNQWHRKSVRKGFNFNVMVVGA